MIPKRISSTATGTAAGIIAILAAMAVAGAIPASAQPGSNCSSINSNFNGTSIAQGNWVWFNAHIAFKGQVTDGLKIYFTDQTLTSPAFGTLSVPDGVIEFSSSASTASTTYFSTGGPTGGPYWLTVVPVSQGGTIFVSGLAWQVSSPTGSNYNPVVWSGCFSVSGSSACAYQLQWQWGAAVYTQFAAPEDGTNNLGVTSTQSNGLQPGTPTAFEHSVIGGARGGGGANYTGSWSGTASVTTTCFSPPTPCTSSTSATMTVNSVTTTGSPITGFEVDIFDCQGSPFASGFTPMSVSLFIGEQYTVAADQTFGGCSFAFWQQTGSSSNTMTLTITGDTTLTAVYDCGSVAGSSLVVNAMGASGQPLSGLFVQLDDSSGTQINSGFTQATFQTTAGATYTVFADSYGSCNFVHWQDGTTINSFTFVATSSTTTLTASYSC